MSTASKRAPFLMTLGLFFAPFLETPKTTPKSQHKCSIFRRERQNDPQSDPRGSPKGDPISSKILIKSSPSRRGRPPATFDLKKWSRRGVPPSKYTENQPKKVVIFTKFRRSIATSFYSKLTKKKWRALRPVFHTFWGIRNQAEYCARAI